MNKQTNFWELYELAKEVLTDIELINNDEFHNETLSIMSSREYTTSISYENVLSIHLTTKGLDMFMEHVRTRSEQIGEEVCEPVMKPMQLTSYLRLSWRGVPGVEFFTLVDAPKEDK